MASQGLRSVALHMGVSLSLLVASVNAQAATTETATTPESDAARVLRYTRELEASPDRADAPELRKWLMEWAVETPDYVVNVCDVLDLAHPGDDTTPHAGELLMQVVYGNAAFQVEHGAHTDELSKQVAAVESALRAYAAFVAKDAKAKVPHLDALVAKRNAGTLREYLTPVVAKECGSRPATTAKSGDPIDAPKASETVFLGGFLQESHVVYPIKLDGWEMQGEHRYDTQEAGASVRFQRAGGKSGWIDVFFYPVGVLSDEDVAKMAGTERQTLLDTWSKSMANPQDMTALATFAVPIGDASGITAYGVDFAYARDGKVLSSAMVFTVDRMYAIKFRYSAEASTSTRTRVRQDLEQFARHMLLRLDISNTGGCGSAQAPRYEGCTGAEPFQPVVKDGMRELRFEYRASEPAPMDRPLRAKRSGTG